MTCVVDFGLHILGEAMKVRPSNKELPVPRVRRKDVELKFSRWVQKNTWKEWL